MAEREYIVSLKKGVDYDQFWDQIENASEADGFVPTRRVDIVNDRPGSLRSCHYLLTNEEAARLRNDPRVYGVDIPIEQRDDIEEILFAEQSGNFSKQMPWHSGVLQGFDGINWGLKRCIHETNVFGANLTTTGNYTYNLDGTGVDVVILDSGIDVTHPEFHDADGISRIQQIDWYEVSGLTGTMPANHYTDTNGHGTHVAGIAAGKRFGWAKNAKIYSIKMTGSGSISSTIRYDMIKLWHRNKPVDPATGYKRPTIVNMSFGSVITYDGVAQGLGGSYRGTPWTGTTIDINKGMNPIGSNLHLISYASIDSDIQEMIDEGIHICLAVGNYGHKLDIPGGIDYDNYYTMDSPSAGIVNRYYNRPGSPNSELAIRIGNIDSSIHSSNLEKKNPSSECGPAVDIYAPGTSIWSSLSSLYVGPGSFFPYQYPPNTSFFQSPASGTSMASPQVCGIGALILQANPHATPAQLKNFMLNKSIENMIYDTGLDDDWTDNSGLKNGNNRYLFNLLNSPIQLEIK